jgi:hypothetical protein
VQKPRASQLERWICKEDKMENFAKLLSALSSVAWPLIFLIILYYNRESLKKLIDGSSNIAFEFMGGKVSINPTKKLVDHSSSDKLPAILSDEKLPADYFYINHKSHLNEEKQEKYKSRTGLNFDLYNIEVSVESYYKEAIEKVEKVEYYLHESYPEPIYIKTNKKDNFLLKELAYGEYVLISKVFLKGQNTPIVLNRYINLTN